MDGEFNKYEYDQTRGVRNDRAIKPNPFAYSALNSASQGEEYSAFRENNGVEVRGKPSVAVKAKESEAERKKVVSAVAAIVGAVVVGVVSVEEIIAPLPKIDHTLETYADAVRYTISYDSSQYTPKNDIKVVVKNDFTDREQVFSIVNDDKTDGAENDGVQADAAIADDNAADRTDDKSVAEPVDYTVTYEGYFENLQTDMTYTFKVFDGTRTLVTDTFRTKGAQMTLTDEQLKFDSFNVTDTSVSGSLRIVDYTPSGELSVGLSGENDERLTKVRLEGGDNDAHFEGKVTTPVFAGEDGGGEGDFIDEEQFFHGFKEPDGSIMIEFWFEDLTPNKAYALNLCDGDRIIYTLKFGTKEKDYTISDEQISFEEFEFYDGSLSAYTVIRNYEKLGDMSVKLIGNGATRVKNVFFEQHDQPIEETDIDWDNTISGWQEDGEIYLSIWFDGIVATVEYQLEIIDGGHVIYVKTFTMPADPEVSAEYEYEDKTELEVDLKFTPFTPSKQTSVTLSGGSVYYDKAVYFSEEDVLDGEANYILALPDNVNGGYTVSCKFDGLTPSTTYYLTVYYGGSTVFENDYTTLDNGQLTDNDVVFSGFDPTSTEASATVYVYNYKIKGDMYLTVAPADGVGTAQSKSFYFLDGSDVPSEIDQRSVVFAQTLDDGTLYFSFYFDNLTPDTSYVLAIYDDEETIYSTTFATDRSAGFNFALADVDVNSASVEMVISYYEVQSTLYVAVTSPTGGGQQKQVVIASEPLTETDEYVYATVTEDGIISFTVNFTGLTPSTQYVFTLKDGENTVYDNTLTTSDKVYTVSDDQVNEELSADRRSVIGYFGITGYEPEGLITVSVTSEYDDLQTVTVYFNENDLPEEGDNVLASIDGDTGEISFEFSFDGLIAGVTYEISLYDNGNYMYSASFATVSAAITENMISFENVAVNYNEISGTAKISDYSDHGYMEIWLTDKNETVVARSNLAFLDDNGLVIDQNELTDNCIYANVIDGAVVFGFDFTGLNELTEYTFTIYNDNEEVYSCAFETPEKILLSDEQVELDVTDVTYHGFGVSMSVTGYQPQSALSVKLIAGGETKLVQTIVEEQEAHSFAEDEDGAYYVIDQAGGNVNVMLSFNYLTQSTDYTLEFYDGEDLLYRSTASTTAKQYLVDGSNVNEDIEVNKYSIFGTVDVSEYRVDGSVTVTITGGGATLTRNVYFSQDSIPDGASEEDYFFGEYDYEQKRLLISYSFVELAPATDYTIELKEDGNLMYSVEKTTADYRLTSEQATFNVYPTKTGFTYKFELSGFKREKDMSVVVRLPNGGLTAYTSQISYEYGNETQDAFVYGYDSGSGLTASTTYELAVLEGEYEICSTTFTTHDYALNDSQVSVANEYHQYDEAGEFFITNMQITGYNPVNNIYLGAYDSSGTLVQYSDKIVYIAGSDSPAASVDGSITKSGEAVSNIVIRNISIGDLTPGEVYYFKIFDGNTLLYEAVWIAATA